MTSEGRDIIFGWKGRRLALLFLYPLILSKMINMQQDPINPAVPEVPSQERISPTKRGIQWMAVWVTRFFCWWCQSQGQTCQRRWFHMHRSLIHLLGFHKMRENEHGLAAYKAATPSTQAGEPWENKQSARPPTVGSEGNGSQRGPRPHQSSQGPLERAGHWQLQRRSEAPQRGIWEGKK